MQYFCFIDKAPPYRFMSTARSMSSRQAVQALLAMFVS